MRQVNPADVRCDRCNRMALQPCIDDGALPAGRLFHQERIDKAAKQTEEQNARYERCAHSPA